MMVFHTMERGRFKSPVPYFHPFHGAAPRQESTESASHPFFVPCRESLPSDVLKATVSMRIMRDFRPALPPEYLCTSRVRLKICCGIRPRLRARCGRLFSRSRGCPRDRPFTVQEDSDSEAHRLRERDAAAGTVRLAEPVPHARRHVRHRIGWREVRYCMHIIGVEEISHTEDNPGRGRRDILWRMTLSPPVPPAEILKNSYNIM